MRERLRNFIHGIPCFEIVYFRFFTPFYVDSLKRPQELEQYTRDKLFLIHLSSYVATHTVACTFRVFRWRTARHGWHMDTVRDTWKMYEERKGRAKKFQLRHAT